MKKLSIVVSAFLLISGFMVPAHALLVDNGDGTISDCDLGIMWLKDAKAPNSSSLTYQEALEYVASRNAENYLEHNDWRLPGGTNPSIATCHTDDGQYYHECTDTEFSHLFFDELGGSSGFAIDQVWVGYPEFSIEPNDDPDLALFDNLPISSSPGPAKEFWTQMEYDASHTWTFDFHGGSYKDILSDASSTYRLCAWIVRDFTGECELSRGSVILHDLSGSMTWSHQGNMNVPPEEQRVSLAKSAALFFLDLLYIHGEDVVHFGIAEFPPHPWNSSVGCNGNVLNDVALFTAATYNASTNTINNELQTGGNTPLLAGLEVASNMFTSDIQRRSILLLSDGYHNCPTTVSVGHADLEACISSLVDKNIQVSAVGFARPEDIDNTILGEIASRTTGEYHGVTGPTFDPATWDPAIDLKDTYKNILTEDLGIEGILDPVIVLDRGETYSFPVQICDADTLVSIFATWRYAGDKVTLKLYSSDGEEVPASAMRTSEANTHVIKSISHDFLRETGKVTSEPWRVELVVDSLIKNKAVTCLYGALASSSLKLKVSTDKSSYKTGEQIKITASVQDHGVALTDLTEIYAHVSLPKEGKGNWYAANIESLPQIFAIQDTNFAERLAAKQKAARYITEVMGNDFPDRSEVLTIEMTDDGSGVDEHTGDGVYTAVLQDTKIEGSCIFRIYAQGKTESGIPFTREKQSSRVVNVGVSSDVSVVKTKKLVRENQMYDFYQIVVTPKDEWGNYLGPGHSGGIKVHFSHGSYGGRIVDHMNGDYSTQLALSKLQDPRKVKIYIAIGDVTITKSLTGPIIDCGALHIIILILLVLVIIWLFFACCRRRKV